ncbi:MAG: carbohydrate kinase family protein [Promethearchaeota archaeon]
MISSRSPETIPTVCCLGEVLIDFIAKEEGRLFEVSSFLKCPGGAPANVAVGVARLGVHTGFIGKVGLDAFGEFLVEELNRNGVDTKGIVRTNKAPTALAFVSRSKAGDRDFLFYREPCADALLTQDELPQDWLQGVQYLHFGGVSLTREPSRQATIHAIELAQSHGAIVSFDPNLRLDLWVDGLEGYQRTLRQVLKTVDIFLPSEEELEALFATKNMKHALIQAHELGPHTICLKRGNQGSLISTKSNDGTLDQFTQSPFDIPVRDTTGAGDGFNAGLLVGLAKGTSLREAVAQGTAVASLVITKIGAMTALPTQDELTKFMKKFAGKVS